MTAAISIEDVSKHFRIVHGGASSLKEIVIGRNRTSVEEFWALRDVTAELPEGETIGLIGPNGSGKTTLLKIIAGILSPTSGRVKLRGRVASLLELGAGFHPDLTGRENVYINASILGLSRKEVDRIFDDIVAFSGLERFIDNQVKYYSSGMFVRLGFAVAINVDPAILLVDEVLAVGDEAFQARCLERVRDFQQQGRTIVYVSHALDQVRDLCSHALYLQDGRLEVAGRTGDAIREFRLALYGISETDVDGADTIGGGQVRITSVRWNGEERRALMIESGAPLQLEIDFQPGPDAETLTDPRVGFAVYDQLDHEIFGVDNYRADAPIDEIHGPATVTFDIDSVPLTTGKYKVTLGIGSNTGAVWAWQDHAYTIEVANTTALNGNVLFPVRASASAAGALRSASP